MINTKHMSITLMAVSSQMAPTFVSSFNVPTSINTHLPRYQRYQRSHGGVSSRGNCNTHRAVEEAFLEDVDGIGESTETSTSSLPSSVVASHVDEVTGSDEILAALSENASILESTALVEEIVGTTLMDAPDSSNDGNDSTSPESNAVDISTTDGILSTLSDDAQLVDPAVLVEEIIGSALMDSGTDVNDPLSPPLAPVKEETAVIEEEVIVAPSLAKIVKFAVPAIGVWLCSPLLSLIDTSSVGLLSGTAQQAALYPAVSVTDYGALLVAFMYTATTNIVAGEQEKESSSEDKPETSKCLIQALQLSLYVGGALGGILTLFGRQLLKGIIGNDAIDPEVFSAALKYVQIRALGMPAAVVIGSAQSACLGMQDIRSPLYVLLAAAVVNFLGDMIFVPLSNPWFGGASGAAWATVFSQYSALFLFLKWLTHKPTPPTVNLTSAILELTGKSDEGKGRRKKFRKALKALSFKTEGDDAENERPVWRAIAPFKYISNIMDKEKTEKKETPFSTRGFLSGKLRKRNLLRFPEDANKFWPYFVPVTTTSVGRVSTYVSMGHVVSSALGTVNMAANQIILSVFYCLTPIADSLNLTAQSFIPGIFGKSPSRNRTKALRQAVRNFLKAGLIFGTGMAFAVGVVPFIGGAFTSDPTVLATVNKVAPILAAIFSVHGVICAGEGLLLGQKDLGFLGKAYAAFFAAVPYFMLRIKKAALAGSQLADLASLWRVFLSYQVVRIGMWLFRLNQLNDQRTTAEAPKK